MTLRSILVIALLTSSAAAQPRPEGATHAVPANLPRPPAAQIKKTPVSDLKDNPAKKPIRALEDLVFGMEKSSSTIWNYLNGMVMSDGELRRVDKQLTELRQHLAAVKAANAGWNRLAEYEQRVAYLEQAAAAGRGQRVAVEAAAAKADADAAQAAASAWKAKRATDAGVAHALHRKHVGKIVFAASEIAAGDANASLVTTVDVDAPLFARGYFAESPWNALHTAGVDCGDAPSNLQKLSIVFRVQVNGGEWIPFGSTTMDLDAFRTETSAPGSQYGSYTVGGTFTAGEDEARGTFRWITSVAPRMKVGANTVNLQMAAWCYAAQNDVVIASGTLTVAATKAQLAALARRLSIPLSASVHPASVLAPYKVKLQRMYTSHDYELLDVRTVDDWRPVRHP